MQYQIKMMTPVSYAKYGQVLVLPTDQPPAFSLDYVDFWNSPLTYEIKGATDIGICVVKKKRRGYIDLLERHLASEEVTVPLDGDMVIAVAPGKDVNDPDEVPDPKEIEVFLVRQKQTFTMYPGVWHGAPFAIDGNYLSMLVFLKHDTFHNDGQFREIEPPVEFDLDL